MSFTGRRLFSLPYLSLGHSLRNRKLEIIVSDGFGYESPYATLTQMCYALAPIFESNAGMYGHASHFYFHDEYNGTEGKWITGSFGTLDFRSGLEPV